MVEDDGAVGVLGAQAAMIEIETAVGRDKPHHVGRRFAEVVEIIGLRLMQTAREPDRLAAPVDDLIDAGAHFVALARCSAPC